MISMRESSVEKYEREGKGQKTGNEPWLCSNSFGPICPLFGLENAAIRIEYTHCNTDVL